jgi:hypothetical protein
MSAESTLRCTPLLLVLEQLVARQLAAAPDDARELRIVELHLMLLAALAAEMETDAGAPPRHVAGAQRGEPVGTVFARIAFVADADEGPLEQAHHRGNHLVARQARQAQVGLHAPADTGQGAREVGEPVVFVFVALLAPGGMVAILLAPARIPAGGLHVPAARRTDPDRGPGGRNRQRADALQHRRLAQRPAVRRAIAEAAAARRRAMPGTSSCM